MYYDMVNFFIVSTRLEATKQSKSPARTIFFMIDGWTQTKPIA